jgi:hypothetical protein
VLRTGVPTERQESTVTDRSQENGNTILLRKKIDMIRKVVCEAIDINPEKRKFQLREIHFAFLNKGIAV